MFFCDALFVCIPRLLSTLLRYRSYYTKYLRAQLVVHHPPEIPHSTPLSTNKKQCADTVFLHVVLPAGIEPAASVPQTNVLSIKLRERMLYINICAVIVL